MSVSPSLTRRVRKGETFPAGLGRGNMPCRVRKRETCFGVGWVRLG